jgi:high-affinity iron transporter
MLATLIIVFREAIEAGLIVGIVLAATQGVPGRGRQVTLGIAGGLGGAAIVAMFAGAISDAFAGSGQELLNAAILSLAVVMLAWHTVWMARHGRAMATEMRGVSTAVRQGRRPTSALGIVVGIAVLREGSEVVLFLYGIAASGGESAGTMLAGGLAGLTLGVGLSLLTHAGLVRMPARTLFRVIFWLVALLAAGMASQAAFFLQSGGLTDVLSHPVWNTAALLSEKSLTGRVLHTLIGYSDNPTQLQLLAYTTTLATIIALSRLLAPAPRPVVPVLQSQ